MTLTRRQFLKRSATIAAGASVAPAMSWLPGTGVAYAAGPADAIVVFVQFYGGNDGLNTVYPVDGAQRTKYEQLRPTLKLPKNVGELSNWDLEGFDVTSGVLSVGTDGSGTEYALHPAMKGMHDIYTAGELAVVPGVHYPHANYSHFSSEVIYYTGDPAITSGLGWMGKYLDLSAFSATEVPAVMLGGEYNPLFTPTGTSLFAFNSLRELRFPAGTRREERADAFEAICAESALSDELAFPELVLLGNTGVAAIQKFEEYYQNDAPNGKVEALMVDGDGNYQPYVPLVYTSPLNPGDNPNIEGNYLAEDLKHVAAIIRSDVGARFFHVGIGGFDTHSHQEDGFYHSYLLNRVSEAIAAFWNEMKTPITLPGGYSGYLTGDLSSRVLIVTLTEFGRTNKQNSSGASTAGTDHGGSVVEFVVGSTVNPGIHGTHPTLDDAELDDDMRIAHDFRDFYGTILEKWLNVAPADIGPGPGKLFAATTDPDWLGQDYTAYTAIPFLP